MITVFGPDFSFRNRRFFDAVKMMRELREKINKEIEHLTPEQVVDYFRIHGEKFEKETGFSKRQASVIT
jgi:hypothetical protein